MTSSNSSNSSSSVALLARAARAAASSVSNLSAHQKSSVLRKLYDVLGERKDQILTANKLDLDGFKGEASMRKRLDLSMPASKFDSMRDGVLDVDKLDDPTGKVTYASRLAEDLHLYRITVPIGVLLIIFEARPEVVVQISALGLKSGNAVLLKGGSEASHTNAALFACVREAFAVEGVHDGIGLVEGRAAISELLSMDREIDLVIPRGSADLVRYIQGNTRIPVLGHADGLCTTYIDASADLAKTIRVVLDAKTSYPAACNATETLLIHSAASARILPALGAALHAANVRVHSDPASRSYLPSHPTLSRDATDDDWDTEFLDNVVAIKTVGSLQEAIEHIAAHGSRHTDAIITEDREAAEYFMSRVDAAGVYWNASTRFADGFRYGFGAEIGVSTNKTHARGPVGLEGLVIYRYRLYGNGHATTDYGPGKSEYLHEAIPLDLARGWMDAEGTRKRKDNGNH